MASPAALITGSARRLGKAMALRLAEQGHDIALHYRNSADDATETKAEVERHGVRCVTFQNSLDTLADIKTLLDKAFTEFPQLNCLINNASMFQKTEFLSSQESDFDQNFHIHVKVPYFLLQGFALRCRSGQAINMVDTAVVRNQDDHFAYLLSKKTLWEFTKMAAIELAPSIRVNAIAPGLILPSPGITGELYERYAIVNPLQRAATIDDILLALDYLIKAEQVTGQCLFVDGGVHVSPLEQLKQSRRPVLS